MESLDSTRIHVSLMSAYLNNVEARDKMCRAIQFGSKLVSGGKPGTAHDVDDSTSLARKVFRLLKCLNEFEALITPQDTSKKFPVVALEKSAHSLRAVSLALEHLVWAGTVGIYKNKERTIMLQTFSLYFYLGGRTCSSLLELLQLVLYFKEHHGTQTSDEEKKRRKQMYSEGTLNLAKSLMDIIVAIGLLQLVPKKITPRVTGAFGVVSSLITSYQVFQAIHVPRRHLQG